MTDEYVHQPDLIERLRWSDGWFFEDPFDHTTYASDDPLEAAYEIERLMKLLKMVWKREVPEIGTLDWNYLMSIVEPNAALGETK